MKIISRIIFPLGLCAMLLAGCQDKEAELLVPKLYFEASKTVIERDGETTYSVELKSRLTTMVEEDVNVTYTIEGEDVVNAYNYRVNPVSGFKHSLAASLFR